MADNFSLDDILAEIDAKKAMRDSAAEEAESKPQNDFSVTSIIKEEELTAAVKKAELQKEKPAPKETPFIREKKNPEPKQAKSSLLKAPKWEKSKPEKTKKEILPQSEPILKADTAPLPVKEAKEPKKPEETVQKEEIGFKPKVSEGGIRKSFSRKDEDEDETEGFSFYGKNKEKKGKTEKSDNSLYAKRPKEKVGSRMIDRIAEKIAVRVEEETSEIEEAPAFAPEATQIIEPIPKAEKTKLQEEKTQLIQKEDKPKQEEKAFPKIDIKKPQKRPEYNTMQRKLIDRQLKAEEHFENPEELIDAINPYEVKSKAEDFNIYLGGGDTQGIAGNDLKKLAEESSSPNALKAEDYLVKEKTVKLAKEETKEQDLAHTIEKTSPVKQYIPQNKQKQQGKKQANPSADLLEGTKIIKPTEKEKRSNDALLQKLNLALAKTHMEEEEKKRTAGLSITGTTVTNLKAPTSGLNLDDGRVIMATGVLTDENDEIKGKAKRKLRDFVMDADSEEEEEEEDFDSYDSTGQIWSDLCESHRVIKIRLALLLAVTLFMGIIGLLNDLGKGVIFNFFGMDVTFLNRIENVQGYLFYNLILGVVVLGICSSVIINGLSKLFKLRADCDSVCAVTAVAAVISAAVNIISSDDVLTGQAFVFVPVAAAGLMFNTLGKLVMVKRAKRNFRFVSGDSAKYSAIIAEDEVASALTKGVVGTVPVLAAMRKTELLTDFLKSSYGEDKADRLSRKLVPIALGAALLLAVIAFFIPYGIEGLQNDIYHAVSVFVAVLAAATPFSMMFVCNIPLTRAGTELGKADSVILGYAPAEEYSEVNSVMMDASLLFPAGTVTYSNIKHCKQPNSVNNIALDQAIILAASLAIKSGSVMSNMFKDMINDKEDILVKVENCVYEDNMGVLGWYGNKRMIMGSRDQMKRHDIKVPDMKKVNKYAKENTETIYLSVGGEIVIMFFVELMANPEVKKYLGELTSNDVSIVIKTTDSIVTVSKLAEVFDIPPEKIRILPYSLHEQFSSYTRYVSRGSGAVSCNGTFTGFAKAIVTAKALMKDINLGMCVMLLGALIGVVCAAASALTGNTQLISSTMIMGWNLAWLLLAAGAQCFRRY